MNVTEAVVVCTDPGRGLLPVSMALPKFCTPITKTAPVVAFPVGLLVDHGVKDVVFVIREPDLEWMLMVLRSRSLRDIQREYNVQYDVVTYNFDDDFGAIRRGFALLEGKYAWTAFCDEVVDSHVVLTDVEQDLVKPPFVVLHRNNENARTGRYGTATSVFDLEDGSAGLKFGGVARGVTTGSVVVTGFSVLERSMFVSPKNLSYLETVDALAKESALRGVLLPHLSFWTKLDTFKDLERCYEKFQRLQPRE